MQNNSVFIIHILIFMVEGEAEGKAEEQKSLVLRICLI